MNLKDISVVVTSRNNETTIGECLESVREFAEVLVVDRFSTDNTTAIAGRYPVSIYRRAAGGGDPRDWARRRVSSPWILFLEADEQVTGEAIEDIVAGADPPPGGACFRVTYEYLGGKLRWGACPRRTEPRLVAASGPKPGRQPAFLAGAIVRRQYPDVHSQFDSINRESSRRAQAASRPARWLSIPLLLMVPPAVFLYRYFLRFGLADGARGFLYCLLSSYDSFVRYAKIRELRFAGARPGTGNPAVTD